MPFEAKFNIQGNGSYANEKIVLYSESDIGAIIDSNNLQIETIEGTTIAKSDVDLNTVTITEISKFKWKFSTGSEYYTDSVSHKFEESGKYLVELTVWSEQFTQSGSKYYFTYTTSREIEVNSRFYKFLVDRYPTWETVKNEYYDELMKAAGNFFDKLHKDVTNVYNLMDIDLLPPDYFDVMAQTLGHSESYYNKIGYDINTNDINNYNIIDKIKLGTVTSDEINKFKQFLLFSSEVFREKGTPENIAKFLSFFSINGKAVDLWTEYWGQTEKGLVFDDFIDSTFDENKLSLSWGLVKVLGIDYDYGHLIKNKSSFILNSFYKTQKIENTADTFSESVVISSNNPSWNAYELVKYVSEVSKLDYEKNTQLPVFDFTPVNEWLTPNEVAKLRESLYLPTGIMVEDAPVDYLLNQMDVSGGRIVFDTKTLIYTDTKVCPYNCTITNSTEQTVINYLPTSLIKDIRYDNGSLISNLDSIYDINAYDTVLTTYTAPSSALVAYDYHLIRNFIEFKENSLDEGDIVSLMYDIAETKDVSSVVVSKDIKAKDFDLAAKVVFKSIDNQYSVPNFKKTDNDIFFILRGKQYQTDLYSEIQEYYRIDINSKKASFSLSKVIQGTDSKPILQKFNLTGDKSNPIYEKILLDTTGAEIVIKENVIYEIKVSLLGQTLSTYIRELTSETTTANAISVGIGDNNFGKTIIEPDWIPLVLNISLDVNQEDVIGFNEDGDEVNSYTYKIIDESGYFGIGCRNSYMEINSAYINILDIDDTLYTNIEKEVNLKPRYLEWLRGKQIQLNSYETNIPYFYKRLEDNFDASVQYHTISAQESTSLDTVYFSNITVDNNIAHRYTITFDNEWLRNNFTDKDGQFLKSFYDDIIVPFGSQKSALILENPILGINTSSTSTTTSYYNINGDDITGGRVIYAPTSGAIDTFKYPGLFLANNSVPLNTYSTQPFDNFSGDDNNVGATRSDNGYGNFLYFNSKLKQYKKTGKEVNVTGIYEEITPKSGYFPEIDGELLLPSEKKFKNFFFNPIVTSTSCGYRVLGVHFKNCKDINTTIAKYSTEVNKEVYIYGSYTFHIPKDSVKYAPDNNFTDSNLVNNYVKFNMFVPLGILNKDIRTYSLSKTFVKENPTGGMIIELKGIFVKVPREMIQYYPSENKIEILKSNSLEQKYDELACNYFINTDLELGSGVYSLQDPDFTTGSISGTYSFFLKNDVISLMTSLEDTTQNSIADYNWWLPKATEIWRKRSFETLAIVLDSDVASNINISSTAPCGETAQRLLYGNFIGGCTSSVSASSIKALQVRLLDTINVTDEQDPRINPYSVYYAKIKVKINYSGMSDLGISLLKESEKNNIDVIGYKKDVIFKLAPVETCIEFYVPFSWYDRDNVSLRNLQKNPDNTDNIDYAVLELGNFIRGSYTDKTPTVTFIPYGLMTYLLDTMEQKDRDAVTNSIGLPDFTTWNEYFINNMSVEMIAERIPSTMYKIVSQNGDDVITNTNTNTHKILHKYGISNSINLNFGSFVELSYNISQVGWDVIETNRCFADGNAQQFFDIPTAIYDISSWNENIRSVSLNNYELSKQQYKILPTSIKFTSPETLQYLKGSEMNGKFYYNLYYNKVADKSNYQINEYLNNFNTFNEINFIPYEATEDGVFKIVERNPSLSILLQNNDPLYEIVNIDGNACMKVLTNKTTLSSIFGKSGYQNREVPISYNTSPLPIIQKLFVIDQNSPIFDLKTDVYFDGSLDSLVGYNGKKLEFILKAENTYNSITKEYNLSSYYFVGIGTYGFDIALGSAKYDMVTGTQQKTFLAGFGDYNTKNIKTNTWYSLRVIITSEFIRVIFNEKSEAERLVINYSLISNDADMLSGNGEELAYLVKGLSTLDITYPDKIGEKAGALFASTNVNNDLIKSIRPSGFITGLNIFNNLTYVTNISYRIEMPKDRILSDAKDSSDMSSILEDISKKYGQVTNVSFIGKTLNNTIVVLADGNVYYKKHDVVKFKENVTSVKVMSHVVLIETVTNNIKDVMIVHETFDSQHSLYVKDNNFNIDNINKYLSFTNRNIKNIYISNSKIYVEFYNLLV